jgi:hypothetical protein
VSIIIVIDRYSISFDNTSTNYNYHLHLYDGIVRHFSIVLLRFSSVNFLVAFCLCSTHVAMFFVVFVALLCHNST